MRGWSFFSADVRRARRRPPQSIFRLKRVAFQNTMRPVVLRKKRGFPPGFGRAELCRRLASHLFQTRNALKKTAGDPAGPPAVACSTQKSLAAIRPPRGSPPYVRSTAARRRKAWRRSRRNSGAPRPPAGRGRNRAWSGRLRRSCRNRHCSTCRRRAGAPRAPSPRGARQNTRSPWAHRSPGWRGKAANNDARDGIPPPRSCPAAPSRRPPVCRRNRQARS